MWNKSTKQRKATLRRHHEVRSAEEQRQRDETIRRAQDAAIRNGQRRARARAAKMAVKFAGGR